VPPALPRFDPQALHPDRIDSLPAFASLARKRLHHPCRSFPVEFLCGRSFFTGVSFPLSLIQVEALCNQIFPPVNGAARR